MGQAAGRERAILAVLAAVQFTNIVDFMIVMPLGPDLMEVLRITPAQFGLIVSSYTFSACAAGLLAAFFIDRFDRKASFLTLYVGFLICTLLCGLAPTYPWLLAARVGTGAFGGVLGGLALTIIGDIFPEERRGAATGTLMSAFAVASVVGVPLGLYAGNHYGWHAPFLMLAEIGLFVLVIGAFVMPSIRGHMDHPAEARSPWAEMGATLTEPNHLRAFALVVTLMLGGFAVIPYISPYLVANVGVTRQGLPLVYVAGGIMTLLTARPIGKLADRFGKLRVYHIVAPLAAVMMLAVTNLPRVPLAAAVAVVALLMVGNAGRMVVAMAMVTACVEPRRRGSFMSVNSAVQHLASGLGAFVGGLILGKAADGSLTHFPRVGYVAVAATLASLYVAGRLRTVSAKARPPVFADLLDDPTFDLPVSETA